MIFGIFDEVYSILKRWEPRKKYPREEGYRDDILQFLRRNLNESFWTTKSI